MIRIASILNFCLTLCLSVSTEGSAQDKPNIVFIMADDLGYGDIGAYGQQFIQTPNLDRMASEGLTFTQHYAGTSVCAPSRCVLMTGLHTGHSEIRANKEFAPNGQLPLSDSAVTIATVLKNNGYHTGLIGKWGLGEFGTSGDPIRHGFDFFYGYTDQVLAHNHFPEFLLRNGKKELLNNTVRYLDSNAWHKGRGSVTTRKMDFADELFTQEAIRFIERNKDQPFFLYLPYIIPHDNGEAEEGSRFEAPTQLHYKNKSGWTKDEKDYAASITYLDQYVGRILNYLKKAGIARNTLVIFTSDNGPATDRFRFNSSGGLRGIKRDLYEGGIRVPFVAWWPGTITAGTTTNHISTFYDFFATASALVGAADIPATDGISFLPVLLGRQQESHPYIYFEIHEQSGGQALRKGDWKLVLNNMKSELPNAPELYNLAKDPLESSNIASDNPELVSELLDVIKTARTPSKMFPMPGDQL